ncbi:MAG: hypothetical protein ACLQVN_08260, partial [Bryobacteraceae bacterium]
HNPKPPSPSDTQRVAVGATPCYSKKDSHECAADPQVTLDEFEKQYAGLHLVHAAVDYWCARDGLKRH